MNTLEAVSTRRSVRAFKPDPVPDEVLSRIVEAASRTPSWANTQPWETFIARGETLKRIRQGFLDCYAGQEKAATEIERPAEWSEKARARQRQIHPDMLRECGEEASAQFGKLNQNLFNAPCVAYVTLDKVHPQWSLFDAGAYCQSLMLCAWDEGIGSIPAITLVTYPQVLRKELGIGEDLTVAIGIALGYPDYSNAINNFRSSRDPLTQTVHWRS